METRRLLDPAGLRLSTLEHRSSSRRVLATYSCRLEVLAPWVSCTVAGHVQSVTDSCPAEIGATVFSAPAATITAAPDTTFASIGTRDDYVILEARSAVLPSLVRKRLAAPVPTSVCEPFLTECPNLRGELNCVNVKADIFSE